MAVDIKSLLYAGVWREPWITGVVPDLSRSGLHASQVGDFAWSAVGSGEHASRYGLMKTGTSASKAVTVPVPVLTTGAVAGWVAYNNIHSGFAEQSDGHLQGWGFGLRNGRVRFLWTGGSVDISPPDFGDGVLRHYAASWGGGVGKVWVDGETIWEGDASVSLAGDTPLTIGSTATISAHGQYALRTNDKAADILIRSTPWTDAEVAWLANPANDLRAVGGGTRQLLYSPHLLGSFP